MTQKGSKLPLFFGNPRKKQIQETETSQVADEYESGQFSEKQNINIQKIRGINRRENGRVNLGILLLTLGITWVCMAAEVNITSGYDAQKILQEKASREHSCWRQTKQAEQRKDVRY